MWKKVILETFMAGNFYHGTLQALAHSRTWVSWGGASGGTKGVLSLKFVTNKNGKKVLVIP